MSLLRKTADLLSFPFTRPGRVARVKNWISCVPEGKELLDFAEKHGYTITFNPLHAFGTGGIIWRCGRIIEINPFLSDKTLTVTLCHELRHAWQFEQLQRPDKRLHLDFERAAGFQRLVEGDAFVFQAYMAKIIGRALGRDFPYATDPDSGTRNLNPETLAGQSQIFKAFQKSRLAAAYDAHLLHCMRKETSLIAKIFKGRAQRQKWQDKIFSLRTTEELGALSAIPVTSSRQGRYLMYKSDADMLADLYGHVSPKAKEKGEKLAPG